MRKAIGVLIVIFVLTLVFALIIPDQRDLEPDVVEDLSTEVSAVVLDKEVFAFNHIEYSLLSDGRYLAVLDPGGFEGERHGGNLSIFDTFNGAIVEKISNVAGFAPVSSSSGAIIFSARTADGFGLFFYDIETGLSSNLNIEGGQGGLVYFGNSEIYRSNNPVSANYIDSENSEEWNFFGVEEWARVDVGVAEVYDAIDGLKFSLDEVWPKVYPVFAEDGVILSSNNVNLVKSGEKFALRLVN